MKSYDYSQIGRCFFVGMLIAPKIIKVEGLFCIKAMSNRQFNNVHNAKSKK